MYDIEKLKTEFDLRDFAATFTPLKAKSRNEKEWTGPCPVCGGEDRFNVQQDRWLCRPCTDGKWRDLIHLAGHVWGLDCGTSADFIEICRRLDAEETSEFRPVLENRMALDLEKDAPPAADWINRAIAVMELCEHTLWLPEYSKVTDWLRRRGLHNETIRRFRIGYNPVSQKIAGHWVYGGLVIPHWDGVVMWGIKIRLNRDGAATFCRIHNVNEAPKYIQVKGSRQNVFNVSSLAGKDSAFVVEGELDGMLLEQEIGDKAGVITLGSASNSLSDRWIPQLLPIQKFYLGLDSDEAGQNARRLWKKTVGKRGYLADLPNGFKDVTEYAQAGNDLRSWALQHMKFPKESRPFKRIRFDPAKLCNILPDRYLVLSADQVECIYDTEQEFIEHMHSVVLVREAIKLGGVLRGQKIGAEI